MEKTVFKHKVLSYLICSFLGIAAGLAVAFFSRFPGDDLWAFALFSSQTFGFWICTCSLISLFSSKNYVAGISTALYVYFMFYVTGIFKRLANVEHGYSTMQYFYNGFWQELAYGLLPAAGCFALAFVLWYGRKNKPVFIVLRFMPSVFIFAEAVLIAVKVITAGYGLFMALVDLICACIYLLLIIKLSEKKCEKSNGKQRSKT